jgi:hypothetical protein
VSDQSTLQAIVQCPSCSREVRGKFCSHCGERAYSRDDLRVGSFLREAFHELVDVDSKFVTTIKNLIMRPGFLTLEILKGRRNMYLKPFRLYAIVVVAHFVIFASIPAADIFNLDRFPPLKAAPVLKQKLHEAEAASGKDHVEFTNLISQKVKDNLEIFLYIVVFLAAGIMHLLFPSFKRFYVEHLHFVFHVFSFALVRNILFIPLFILDLPVLSFVLVIATQLVYVFLAIKEVYPQAAHVIVVKIAVLLISLLAMFYAALHVCVIVGLEQI